MLHCFSFKENSVLSSSSGAFSTASTSATDITNLSVNITVSGNHPILLMLVHDGSANAGYVGSQNSTSPYSTYSEIVFKRGSSSLSALAAQDSPTSGSGTFKLLNPLGAYVMFDRPSVGTHTYKAAMAVGSSNDTGYCYYAKLLAVEVFV